MNKNILLYKLKFLGSDKERIFNIYIKEPKSFETYKDFKDSFNSLLIARDKNINVLLKLGEKSIEVIKKNNIKKNYIFYKFLYQNNIVWLNKNMVELL